jgi:hypothetical protein
VSHSPDIGVRLRRTTDAKAQDSKATAIKSGSPLQFTKATPACKVPPLLGSSIPHKIEITIWCTSHNHRANLGNTIHAAARNFHCAQIHVLFSSGSNPRGFTP